MSASTCVVSEDDQVDNESMDEQKQSNEVVTKETSNKTEVLWFNVVITVALLVAALYGVCLAFTSAKFATIIFAIIVSEFAQIGVTAGAHRLWSHRSYKAKWPLRLLLTAMQTIAYEYTIIFWARDHRLHHKHCDTDADPHNSKRGFFFSHIGWLLCRENSEVTEKGKSIDVTDLLRDPILRFQREYFLILGPLAAFFLPTIIAVYGWNETWNNAFFVAGILRWTVTINSSFLINSYAHMFGDKPYDRNINPTQTRLVSVLAMGEGWHNYHHTFPWDYKAAELGHYFFNHTAAFIDFFAWVGWAYDLKTVSTDVVKKRVQRTGDGSHALWGWNDKDITKEDQEATVVTHQKQM